VVRNDQLQPASEEQVRDITLETPRRTLSRTAFAILILSPALLLTVGVLWPFITAIYYSLTNFSFNNVYVSFVGFANYTQMFQSSAFWHSVLVTLEYSVCATSVEMVLGIGIALLLNVESRFMKLARTLVIIPLMISPAIGTLMWRLMTNPTYGVLDQYLKLVGLGHFPWGNSPNTAMFSVVTIDVWIYTPFVILLVLAGLQSLPKAPYEAASIDGGSWWFRFRTLTLPLLMPVLIITLVFRLMLSIQEFTIIYGLTSGGPGNTLMNLPNEAYEHGFLYLSFGPSLAYMVFLWAIVFIISQVLVIYWGKAQARAAGL
jgi:multiple sugar transport system permease protein